tara:strand:- start:9833 stop:10183 length:351 start_codon:yes stop_codon:yes gene_type:complete
MASPEGGRRELPEFLQTILIYAREGFAEVNAVQGLVIALIATLMMTRWSRILFVVAGAVVANIAVDLLQPVMFEQAEFRLPPVLEIGWWNHLLLLFAGFLVVIGIMFSIKRVVTKG